MEYVASDQYNPFGLDPPCSRYVAGFGDTSAHFHVIGDNPRVHGGLDSEIPFTDKPWSERFFSTLERSGLVREFDLETPRVDCSGTFFSYLCLCASPLEPQENTAIRPEDGQPKRKSGPVSDGWRPTEQEYAETEPYFDAELRAITAHVLLPVGKRATEHVLETFTTFETGEADHCERHAEELRGSGWLVVPVKEPSAWTETDEEKLVESLTELLDSDYRQTSDLGRFIPDDRPYFVR